MSPPGRRPTVRTTNDERTMARSRYAVTTEAPRLARARIRRRRGLRRRLGLALGVAVAATAALAGPARAGTTLLGGLTSQSQVASTAPANSPNLLSP